MPYRDIQTDLEKADKTWWTWKVNVEIHCGSCRRFGPLTWGRVKWGHRTYFVIGFPWLCMWI